MSVKFTANFFASAQTNFKFVVQALCFASKLLKYVKFTYLIVR